MSRLVNPDFETGKPKPWDRLNPSNAVSFSVDASNSITPARTGSQYLRFRTAIPGGSMAQDIMVSMPSVTVLAYVRAGGANVSGALAVWDLDANRNSFIPFTVGQTWTQLSVVLGLENTA